MRKKPSIHKTLSPKFVNAIFVTLLILNAFVLFKFERERQPHIERIETTVITNHLIVVTNYISSTSSHPVDTNKVATVLARDRSVSSPYTFWTIQNHRYITYHGQHLTVGSPTSYGRIVEIYPERVLLDTGIWLVNTSQSSHSHISTKSLTPLESIAYDRVRD